MARSYCGYDNINYNPKIYSDETLEKIPKIASFDQKPFCYNTTIRVANSVPTITKPKFMPRPVTKPNATPNRAL